MLELETMSTRRMMRVMIFLLVAVLTLGLNAAEPEFIEVCPGIPLQTRTPDFTPGGLILTAFDKSGIWVYNINRDARYPLPDTRPCNRNCRLSPDNRWITFVDLRTNSVGKMRLDGTERTLLADYATDVEWWPDDRLLVWTPGHQAYWQTESGLERQYLNVQGVASLQPGGTWGLIYEPNGDGFKRALLNVDTRDLQGIAGQHIPLGADIPYFNAAAWSPDGRDFAFVAPTVFDENTQIAGGELYLVQPQASTVTQITDLNQIYGAVRINGGVRSELSWSPDSTRIAFWVIELLGPAYESDTGQARIHIVDVNSGTLRAYCGFSTSEHTPDPPRLQWAPDGTHLAFGGNIPADDKGYLLLSLDVETGVFTELSNGIFPAVGAADVVAWGLPPSG
jgi:WD40 repeat protein